MNTEIKNKEFSSPAELTAVTYMACTFKGIRFSLDDLSNRNFHFCAFEDCIFIGVKAIGTKFISCMFRGDVCSVIFKDCIIYSCAFDGLVLSSVNFNECVLSANNFIGCIVKNGVFKKCDFTDCEFFSATFVRTILIDCFWDGSDIQNANLQNVDTSKANLALLGYDERGYLWALKRMKDGTPTISAGCRQDYTIDTALTHWANNPDVQQLLAYGASIARKRGWN
jgi:uncharacterized protein YjbI with pentapeptide repeats